MTIKEISILLGGLVFLTIGILASRHYKWKKIKTYIPIVLGLFLIYISTFGPLSESKKRITEITSIDSTKVISITLQPTRDASYENLTMFKEDRVEIDRNIINEICNSLHEAKVEGSGFLKNPKEACRVEIRFVDNKKISFGVRKSGTTTCISLNSNGESGWHYANLDASDFGKLLNNDKK
jgi:hypothetical protein